MRLYVLTFFFGLLPGTIIAQKSSLPSTQPSVLVVTYRATSQPDSTSPSTRSEMMQLMIGKSLSRFESVSQSKMDSLMATAHQMSSTQNNMQLVGDRFMAIPKNGVKYKIYKNTTNHKIHVFDKIGTSTYQYNESDLILPWVMSTKKTFIAGYSCQLATVIFSGRQFEAWFTKDIPVADGPYKFYGLPGLILKINDTRNHYVFEATQIRKAEQGDLIIFPNDSFTLTTKEAFFKGKQEYDASLVTKLAAKGHSVSDEDKREYERKIKSRNNPLELK